MVNKETKPPNRVAGDSGLKDKTLLVTGGTGFMGKVLVEKVLRTCPEVKRIYLLIRSKRGKSAQERLKEMLAGPLYDLLRKTRGEEILKKVVAVEGDIGELGLGMPKEDRERMANEVQIIFNYAATLRFDIPLKTMIILNTRSTKLLLDLAKECKNLLMFCHVSTAYCYPNEKVLYERAYPPPADADTVIKAVEWLDEEAIEKVSDSILKDVPNAYTFTKALSESLVCAEMDKLPALIVRPSVVIPIMYDPLPGWTNNVNGAIGLLIGAGKGILRTMYCNPNVYADFVPCDIATSAIMAAVFDRLNFVSTRRFYNITTSYFIRVTWAEIIEIGRNIVSGEMPFNGVVWYPGGSMKTNRLLNHICTVLFHYIPAIILDTIIFLSGNTPVVWKIQQRITKGSVALEYYANNQWEFNNDVSRAVVKEMNETESDLYLLDETKMKIDLHAYFVDCIHAARLYIMKESDESLPTARRVIKIMWFLDKFCKTLMIIGFGYLLLHYLVYPLTDAISG